MGKKAYNSVRIALAAKVGGQRSTPTKGSRSLHKGTSRHLLLPRHDGSQTSGAYKKLHVNSELVELLSSVLLSQNLKGTVRGSSVPGKKNGTNLNWVPPGLLIVVNENNWNGGSILVRDGIDVGAIVSEVFWADKKRVFLIHSYNSSSGNYGREISYHEDPVGDMDYCGEPSKDQILGRMGSRGACGRSLLLAPARAH